MLISAAFIACTILPAELRINALNQPFAIQGLAPVFSWKLQPANRQLKNLSQSAYRILVASDQNLLSKNVGDLWDTGRVGSPAIYGIKYAGKPLQPKSDYFWKLQVWDQNGSPSNWTKAERFGTGIQTSADYSAKWIHGAAPQRAKDVLDGAKWIWGHDEAGDKTPVSTHTFTFRFETPLFEGKPMPTKLLATADDQMVVSLDGQEVHRTSGTDVWKKLQSIDLKNLTPGTHTLTITATNATPSPAGLVAALVSELGGKVIVHSTDETWQVNGQPAKVIGPYGMNPWGRIGPASFVTAPAQYFQKSFNVSKKVSRATLYATALGIADFELNGKRVTEDLFSPGWTEYRKQVLYRAFDLTSSLKPGRHNLSAVLGQGWYVGYVAWGAQREHYGDTPMLFMQLDIEYTDGTSESIVTDSSWIASEGPIRDEHFFHGEKYDARPRKREGYAAKVGNPDIGELEAFHGDPVREYARLKAKSIKDLGTGKYLLDFGQNLTGFVHLSVNYPEGTTLTFRHGERLDSNGNLYTENLRLAQAIDSYVCRGGGERWNPRFTFHGFQYVEVSGVPSPPSMETFQAIAISSSTPETGTLVTSDPMLNQLVNNAWWTQKMNFVDIPTDCPQRDERLGWTGDAQAYIRTATYFSDVQAFFQKWLQTLDHSQEPNGNYPKVSPVLKGLDDGGPAWADAGVICPMTIFQVYGDRELLARHYPQMKRFVNFCRDRSTDDLLPPKNYHIYGDWLSINANTPSDVITTAYFAGSARLVAEAARELGFTSDALQYENLYEKIRAAFQKAYVSADGRVSGETQTAYVLALYFDLLTEAQAMLASEHLIENIRSRDWHLSTGFVGTRDLLHVLSKIGRNDVAFRLLHNKTFPSWGFPIANGATSIWERWDGWTPEKGFQDVGMNSFSHYAYGAVVGWMFEKIGGIKELEPGFERILIAPEIDPNLKFARCRYKSVRGDIACHWELKGNRLTIDVQVPVNTTADFKMPGSNERRVLGSGHYQFSIDWSKN
ncbi:family 78 glycoside hydrolase catalytic domain [Kamptonema cortianum]|nr:family 78 glycoside hydrolase catalytic domain [Geitlerinema splendidum]MDK3157098.1 family 78 glycoside hydrolase catalytic domain [Kamptonema cortianum]